MRCLFNTRRFTPQNKITQKWRSFNRSSSLNRYVCPSRHQTWPPQWENSASSCQGSDCLDRIWSYKTATLWCHTLSTVAVSLAAMETSLQCRWCQRQEGRQTFAARMCQRSFPSQVPRLSSTDPAASSPSSCSRYFWGSSMPLLDLLSRHHYLKSVRDW